MVNVLSWDRSVSDNLFCPPRQFDHRKTARRFLRWLLDHGVPVLAWVDHLEEQHGPAAPPTPWEGGTGRAYPIGRFVVKITPDEKEAQAASTLAGKRTTNVAHIYDVRRVGTPSGRTLYAIIQERLNTAVGKKFRVAGGAIYDYLDCFNRPITDVRRALDYINRHVLKPKHRRSRGVQIALRMILHSLKSLYMEHGIFYADPVGPNLAFKGRQISFFDLGRSPTAPQAAPVRLL